MKDKYTPRQGQYLAFIYYYNKINGHAPAESDIRQYFNVTWPSVHQMIITLEKKGLITRIPRQSRSISLLLPRDQLPDLE
jgi:repressor LexA